MMFSINSGQNLQNDYGTKNIVSLQLDYDSINKILRRKFKNKQNMEGKAYFFRLYYTIKVN